MSLSQSMPPNYSSIMYPNSGAVNGSVLPAELAHGTGGNAADYMSKAVGGRRRRRLHRRTIIRSRRSRRGAGRKTRKIRRHRRR